MIKGPIRVNHLQFRIEIRIGHDKRLSAAFNFLILHCKRVVSVGTLYNISLKYNNMLLSKFICILKNILLGVKLALIVIRFLSLRDKDPTYVA